MASSAEGVAMFKNLGQLGGRTGRHKCYARLCEQKLLQNSLALPLCAQYLETKCTQIVVVIAFPAMPCVLGLSMLRAAIEDKMYGDLVVIVFPAMACVLGLGMRPRTVEVCPSWQLQVVFQS